MKYNVELVLKNNQGVCYHLVDANTPMNALCKTISYIHDTGTSQARDSVPFILVERRSVANDSRSRMDTVMLAIDHIAFVRMPREKQ